MKNIKKSIVFGFFALMSLSINAQQEAIFTHYMYNTLAINPGYAGSREALNATILHRSQWVDFKGAPTTQTLTLHGPLKSKKIGIGCSMINDKIGAVNNMSAYVDFAYIIKVGETSHLSFGLKGGINYMQAKLSELAITDQTDVAFQNNINSKILPNFGFGTFYYAEHFYAGISVPKLLESNFRTTEIKFSTKISEEVRHYYLIAGAIFKLSDNVDFKPTTLIRITKAVPIQADITSSFIFRKKIFVGAMFRTGDAIGLLAGYNFTNQIHIGYSYDWSYGLKTIKYNSGTHEIMLSFDFLGKEKSVPRFF